MILLIDPKEVSVADRHGNEKIYIISEIPAVQSREIITQWPVSALPKLGDYKVNEQMFFKMMEYVEVITSEGKTVRLRTRELINNHCDFAQCARLEGLMFQHNWGFFLQGTISSFLETIMQKVPAWISKISTASSALSSLKDAPASTNSEQSIP